MLEGLIQKWRAEAELLRQWKSIKTALTLERCAAMLEAEIAALENASVTVTDAAARAGVCEETVRRAVRDGKIPDIRGKSGAHHRIRLGDLPYLSGLARKPKEKDVRPQSYDPSGHANRLFGQM